MKTSDVMTMEELDLKNHVSYHDVIQRANYSRTITYCCAVDEEGYELDEEAAYENTDVSRILYDLAEVIATDVIAGMGGDVILVATLRGAELVERIPKERVGEFRPYPLLPKEEDEEME